MESGSRNSNLRIEMSCLVGNGVDMRVMRSKRNHLISVIQKHGEQCHPAAQTGAHTELGARIRPGYLDKPWTCNVMVMVIGGLKLGSCPERTPRPRNGVSQASWPRYRAVVM